MHKSRFDVGQKLLKGKSYYDTCKLVLTIIFLFIVFQNLFELTFKTSGYKKNQAWLSYLCC